MAALLEEAFDSGALVFSEPLLEAVEGDARDEFSGRVRSEHGISYDIERKLGLGGTATVYLARDPKHDRPIAIKVLHADVSARVGAERFVREIRLTARLQHPHVLGLLDSGVFDENAAVLARRPYYVMPYVGGETLRARLARDGALPLEEAMRVLREVADALCYAHEAGAIHRDIKPENILLTRGHAVVGDFGIAKAIAAAGGGSDPHEGGSPNDLSNTSIGFTHSSTVLGTPAYMAPEQAAADAHVDHRADLYAWGVVAYETLTERHPFREASGVADLASQDAADVPVPIRVSAPSVPDGLAALVMRCLERAPGDRPGSAVEVLAALDSVAIEVRSAGAERTSASATSRRTRRGVMAALELAVILLATANYRRVWPHTMVVVGTSNAATDVAAMQSAVDHADTVELEGTFNFRRKPTVAVRPSLLSSKFVSPPAAQILVSKPVTILGVPDARGGMATILEGTIPFYVDAPGAHVAIRRVRFVRPVGMAIEIAAAHDLEIASNSVDGVAPFGRAGAAFTINTSGILPLPSDSGRPSDVSGAILIRENEIDVRGGSAGEYALGLLVWSVGVSPKAEVTLDIIGNAIRNTTAPAIMVRRANGRVQIVSNTVETSTGTAADDAVIRLANTGSYQMTSNTITCRWVNCVGISVLSQVEQWPIVSAIVQENKVSMLPPTGSVSADSSAAIEIKGFARSNVVRDNTILGRAHTALAIETFKFGYPEDNAFIDNHLEGFHASLASTLVGSGVLRTRLVHPGTVVDRGVSTTIER
jgi:serine/threonine-protein kinase